ncbi:hypothetical protein JTB14_004324 [Gonioctena quinquepunctata]|nr:hypothetical protein JTB14_004324 [Gonioctena quinquepunctata]
MNQKNELLSLVFRMQGIIKLVLFSVFTVLVTSENTYYWRDWDGSVPSDAYVAATDGRGPLYIAQAYVYNTGLYIGYVQKNEKSIAVNPTTGSGPVKNSKMLKVFCSTSDKLYWLPSNTTATPQLIKFVQPVLGGITSSNGTVYVGRYVAGSYSYIGSIHTDNYVYYRKSDGTGGYSSIYELLIHQMEPKSNC